MTYPALPSTDFMKDSGERLRSLISVLGMKLTEAADAMGVTKHTLNHWLAGNHPVQPYPLYRLAVLKGVDFNFVFLGDWSRLPYEMATLFESEVTAKLAAPSEEAAQATETPKRKRKAKSPSATAPA